MPGLVPGIQGNEHGSLRFVESEQRTLAFVALDCRHKAGNDGVKGKAGKNEQNRRAKKVMTRPIRKLPAEEAWREAFAGFSVPALAWMQPRKAEAFARFEKLGLPTPRTENWRWSEIHRHLNAPYPPLTRPEAVDEAAQPALMENHLLAAADASVLVFVNGVFSEAHSQLMEEEGVEILPLSAAPVAPDWADLAPADDDAFDLLNLAYATDGALIRVRAGVEASIPLLVLNISTGEGHSVHLRHFVRVEAGASFTLYEAQLGSGDHVANVSTRAIVEEGAALTRVQVNQKDERTIQFGRLGADVHAHARLHDTALLTGGRYHRQNTYVDFAGEHAEIVTNSAYLLRNRQHADTRLRVNHAKAHCVSRETFKCVMDDHARGTFQGLIHVAPGASGTDGRMGAHGLLLGEAAEFDSKPELTIYHDDVACAHGSTVGALDEQQLFYLRARGVPEVRARAMLVAAFVAEVFDDIADERVREALSDYAERWLAGEGAA